MGRTAPSLASIEALATLFGDGAEGEPLKALDIQARVLVDMLPAIQRPCPFQVGDLIEQIPEFETYKWPVVGQLAIVSDLLPNSGVPFARNNGAQAECYDIAMLVRANGGWTRFEVESWRFRKYTGAVA